MSSEKREREELEKLYCHFNTTQILLFAKLAKTLLKIDKKEKKNGNFLERKQTR